MGRSCGFLILGAEGGAYDITERDLVKQNHDALVRCIELDGGRSERPRHAGRGRFRHQRAGRHLGLCVGNVMTSCLSAGSRMQEANTAGGGESFRLPL
jgi:hypothetical protein